LETALRGELETRRAWARTTFVAEPHERLAGRMIDDKALTTQRDLTEQDRQRADEVPARSFGSR
jgi:hypothetical protein